jgi:hypothetical protein
VDANAVDANAVDANAVDANALQPVARGIKAMHLRSILIQMS